jgi:DUF4097 and DUF4098 domain-containing protein YvlB
MQSRLLLVATLVAAVATPLAAQRNSRTPARDDRGTDGGDTRFTPSIRSGQRLSISNIDGNITVTQGRNERAEIVAHKVVRKGNGELVKAVLEETSNGYRVCTVYLEDARDNRGCNDGNHHGNGYNRREPLDVDMKYEVRLPAGVQLTANSVDGSIDARGIDTPSTLRTVDGDILYEGVAPEMLNSVDGKITATITNTDWRHTVALRSVDGDIDVTLPRGINTRVSGHTVDGKIDSDFPVTVSGKWGPQSFRGEIGDGRGETLELSTVDGSIRVRSSDGARRSSNEDAPRRRGRP